MKTITIRLSEVEAWALDRLAAVNGTSKNKQIVNLIVKAYGDIDETASIVENNLFGITSGAGWADSAYKSIIESNGYTKEDAARAVNIVRYVLEDSEGENIPEGEMNRLEALLSDLIEYYREA